MYGQAIQRKSAIVCCYCVDLLCLLECKEDKKKGMVLYCHNLKKGIISLSVLSSECHSLHTTQATIWPKWQSIHNNTRILYPGSR